jgi:hypothetical protein
MNENMTSVTNHQKEIAKHTALAFGVEKPPISRFWDDKKENGIFILEAINSPQDGVTSYATIGLSEYPLIFKGKEFGTRVELVGACGSAFPDFANVMATLAFCVINSRWFCAPGIIFPDVVQMYKQSNTMSDIYFAHPFLWEKGLKSKYIGDRKVAWLLAVPISKAESEFAQSNGPAKLEALFVEKDIDIYNLNRASVV